MKTLVAFKLAVQELAAETNTNTSALLCDSALRQHPEIRIKMKKYQEVEDASPKNPSK